MPIPSSGDQDSIDKRWVLPWQKQRKSIIERAMEFPANKRKLF